MALGQNDFQKLLSGHTSAYVRDRIAKENLVKHEILVAIGAATIAIGGAAACSSGGESSSTPSSAASSPNGAASAAKVTVDGQPRNVGQQVVCATNDGKFSIQIGDVITGVIVGLEPDGSAVHNAGLGDVNGVVMSFTEGAPGNSANATKDGNHYRITGTATGVDNANPAQQISKPFEVDATCP